MRSIILCMIVWISATCRLSAQDKENIYSNIPTLEQIAGKWVSVDTVASNPSLRNFRGQALINRDINSVSWLASAPYSGGYHTGRLEVNGEVPVVNKFRWLPYEALRKATMKHWRLYSITSMPADKNAIMWVIKVTNTSRNIRKLSLSLDLIGFISKYDSAWQWGYPYPALHGKTVKRDSEIENIRKYTPSAENASLPNPEKAAFPSDKQVLDCKKYSATADKNKIFIFDHETNAKAAFRILGNRWQMTVHHSGATAQKNVIVKPGETFTIKYLMVFGTNKRVLNRNLRTIGDSFDKVLTGNKQIWHERWQEIFHPHNSLFTGAFPVLATKDSPAKQVYYTGALTMLYLMNTHLPQHEIDFLTGGPKWGATTTFFWDAAFWPTLWAVVAPKMLENHIRSWIHIDLNKYFGEDNLSGKGVGYRYAASYLSLFSLIHSYVTVTKNYDFLKQKIDGKTVLQHLHAWALHWKSLSVYGRNGDTKEVYKLADFGGNPWHLLESVPTYIHIVPSLNAGYVWMMRQVAAFDEKLGYSERADSLFNEADQLVKEILKLYAGDGVWNALYPDGKKVNIRHVMDFAYLGACIPRDIPATIRRQMVGFFYRELKTTHWMRAQSLRDPAADRSLRPDHGPFGAFDGWVAASMDALTQLGYPEKALKFYHDIAPVTQEGIWSQAHALWGTHKREKDARVRIAVRGWCARDATAGIGISQVMLKDFFGFFPQVNGKVINQTWHPDFEGTMYHVHYGNKYYVLKAANGYVTMTAENVEDVL